MKKKCNPFLVGVGQGIGICLYIFVIVRFMMAIEQNPTPELGLMLFVLSAAITGVGFLGYPAFLFLNKKYKASFRVFAGTVVTMLIIMIAATLFIL